MMTTMGRKTSMKAHNHDGNDYHDKENMNDDANKGHNQEKDGEYKDDTGNDNDIALSIKKKMTATILFMTTTLH